MGKKGLIFKVLCYLNECSIFNGSDLSNFILIKTILLNLQNYSFALYKNRILMNAFYSKINFVKEQNQKISNFTLLVY